MTNLTQLTQIFDDEKLRILRNQFAAAALTGLIGGRSRDHVGQDETMATWARAAFAVADAMLAESEKEPQP